MNVTELIEHEDGSATLTVNLSTDEARTMIEWALEQAITNTCLKEMKELEDGDL